MFFKRCGGLIKYYNLCDWWKKSLTSKERKTLKNRYTPMGGSDIIKGSVGGTDVSVVSFLDTLTGYLDNKSHKEIIEKIYEVGDQILNKGNAIEKHFYFARKHKFYYSLRNESDDFLDKAISNALNQVEISKQSSKDFKKKFGTPLPNNTGFKRLAIHYEKNKEYKKAMEICLRAKNEKWSGDWKKRINRLDAKIDD